MRAWIRRIIPVLAVLGIVALGLLLMELDPTTVVAFAAAIQAAATIVLVAVTRRYVMLTGKLAETAQEQMRLSEEQMRLSEEQIRLSEKQISLSTVPNLLFEGGQGDWHVINLGPHSAHIQAIHVELLSSDGSVVGEGLLMTDEHILWGWKAVLEPNKRIEIRQQVNVAPPASTKLSGLVRLVFYFVYGPTGHRTHALDVKLRIESLAASRVISQSVRLDEAPPQLPPTRINQIQPVRES